MSDKSTATLFCTVCEKRKINERWKRNDFYGLLLVKKFRNGFKSFTFITERGLSSSACTTFYILFSQQRNEIVAKESKTKGNDDDLFFENLLHSFVSQLAKATPEIKLAAPSVSLLKWKILNLTGVQFFLF